LVYILDEGSVFDAPIDRIWTYVQSDTEHDHKAIKPVSMEMQGDNVAMLTIDVTMSNMPTTRHKIKSTYYAPFGFVQEYIEGPMTGTKSFQYYIPKGNKTGVTVVGNFVVAGMDDDMTRRIATGFLELAFNEDNENLKKLMVNA
jgi:hypothetical protein